jgi:hypothetical protein
MSRETSGCGLSGITGRRSDRVWTYRIVAHDNGAPTCQPTPARQSHWPPASERRRLSSGHRLPYAAVSLVRTGWIVGQRSVG